MSDNLEHLVNGHRDPEMMMTPDKQFSILLSKSLDCIGYNEDMIKNRVAYWKLKAVIFKFKDPNYPFELIAAGSQAEGVVKFHESDWDLMCVFNDVICTQDPLPYINVRNTTVFQLLCHDTEPGYTKLKLVKMGIIHPEIREYLRNSTFPDIFGDYYLYCDFFIDQMMVKATEENSKITNDILTNSGPAVPVLNPDTPNFIHDEVYSFKCNCPDLLQSWLRRPRRYNWPPHHILYAISQMEAHVVAVGCKGSDTYYQEWRICFTTAEIHLIQSLNDTQTKLYIILKMVAKQILKQVCPEITSYIMKNIVLWMSERLPSDFFTFEQLGCRIIHALWILNQCVAQNNLSSYMIPERNLFKGRIEQTQKLKLIKLLTSFIEEGPSAVFKRIDKIRDAMLLFYREPAMAEEYRIKRDLVEKLELFRNIRVIMIWQANMPKPELLNAIERDELYSNVMGVVGNMILPERQYLSHIGVDVLSIISGTLKTILS